MKIALTFNLKKDEPPPWTPEALREEFYLEADSPATIEAVRAALADRHEVVLIEADQDAYSHFQMERPDLVFNLAEGLWGTARESQIPAMLEMLRIPYVGSDPVTLAVCLDKVRANQILSACRVPTAAFGLANSMADLYDRVDLPVVVKPAAEGSSKGIRNRSLVRTHTELAFEVQRVLTQYGPPVLLEQYLPGREFTVAMLGNGASLRCLPIVEIRFDALPAGSNPIYSYEAKWTWDTESNPLDIFACPAPLDPALEARICELCRDAWRALGLRDWARIDVRLDGEGNPRVLEVNPIPGILPRPEQNSCFPKAARAAGLSFPELIQSVLDVALERINPRR